MKIKANLCRESWPTGTSEDHPLIQDQRPEGSAETLRHNGTQTVLRKYFWVLVGLKLSYLDRWGTGVQTAAGCQSQQGTVTGQERVLSEPEEGGGGRRGGRRVNGLLESPGRPERCRSLRPLK